MKNYKMSNKEACKIQSYRDKRDEVIYDKECKRMSNFSDKILKREENNIDNDNS